MAFIVIVFGLALAGSGAYAGFRGYGLIGTEAGFALALGGAFAVCTGLTLIALGLILRRLNVIGRTLADRPHPAAAESAPSPRVVPPAGERARAASERPAIPTRAASEVETTHENRTTAPAVDVADAGPAHAPAPALPSSVVDILRDSAPADAESPGGSASTNERGEAEATTPDVSLETVERAAASPTIVGVHRAAGAEYALYSDGSILARTPAGDRRFASMDEMRVFLLERRSGDGDQSSSASPTQDSAKA
ncbi:MAG: hypothetical protein KGI57_04700 [Hyphomicrobiales bacterium]|nr:hypothetical protein [Hyphomicrobiales bacterium]